MTCTYFIFFTSPNLKQRQTENVSNIFVLKEIIPDNFNVKFQLDVI